jgi:hypothetical protein
LEKIVTEVERAAAIVKAIEPTHNPETSCMLMAAAIAGQRGLTMKHIRIGSLFWPAKFAEEHPYLSMRGGWGCEGYSEHDKQLCLSEPTIDDDGGFNGHTWLEPEPDTVIDLMHDVEDGMREIYGEDFTVIGRYIPRPPLERRVKKFWRKQMLAAIKAGAREK